MEGREWALPSPPLLVALGSPGGERLAGAAAGGPGGSGSRTPEERKPCPPEPAPPAENINLSLPPAQTVDASRSIEDVHREIRVLSEGAIRAAAHRPLGQLWT